ncbi:hypothetical protein [Nostoc sp. 'Peltigera membranacea cyanobiont' 210A]|nr:hypothetical protein [Nostoc sp. 'Peltigera membranacea cyanobiont' 210A]
MIYYSQAGDGSFIGNKKSCQSLFLSNRIQESGVKIQLGILTEKASE